MLRMPLTVRVARLLVVLRLGVSLFFTALLVSGAVLSPSLQFFTLLLLPLAWMAVTGWLLLRWSTRRPWVRWSVIGLEALTLIHAVVISVIDDEFGWRTAIDVNTLLPLAIVAGLLTPAAARWFSDGSRRDVPVA